MMQTNAKRKKDDVITIEVDTNKIMNLPSSDVLNGNEDNGDQPVTKVMKLETEKPKSDCKIFVIRQVDVENANVTITKMGQHDDSPKELPKVQEEFPKESKCSKSITNQNAPIACRYCLREFKSISFLLNHVYDRHKCKICKLMFRFRPQLKRHLIDVHKIVVQGLACILCDITFVDESALNNHVKEAHDGLKTKKMMFKCIPCNHNFITMTGLKKHVRNSPNHKKYELLSTKMEFACISCDLTCETIEELDEHATKDHTDKDFNCTNCDKVFKGEHNYNKHLNSKIHSKTRPEISTLKCHFCTKIFEGTNPKPMLRAHLKHHEKWRLSLSCAFCEEEFEDLASLHNHIRIIHEGAKSDQRCDFCNTYFPGFQELQAHLEKGHRYDVKFKCDNCPVMFEHAINLVAHQRMVHDGVDYYDKMSCEDQAKVERNFKDSKKNVKAQCENSGIFLPLRFYVKMTVFDIMESRFTKIEFTENLSGRKILGLFTCARRTCNCILNKKVRFAKS